MPLSAFADGPSGAGLAGDMVQLFKGIADQVAAVYGYAHSMADRLCGDDPNAGDPEAEKQVYAVYWLNVIGPEIV